MADGIKCTEYWVAEFQGLWFYVEEFDVIVSMVLL